MIRGIIAILKGKQTPAATALGIALGAMMGLMPKNNMMPYLFFILFFLTTLDKPAAVLASILFTPVGWALDGAAHPLGMALLKMPGLENFWTAAYNAPVLPWTHFNNSVVLGQFIIGLILAVPLFFLARKLAIYYQQNIKPAVDKLKMVQALKALKIYQWWDSIHQ